MSQLAGGRCGRWTRFSGGEGTLHGRPVGRRPLLGARRQARAAAALSRLVGQTGGPVALAKEVVRVGR